MRSLLLIIALSIALISAAAAASSACNVSGNLVNNCGFETGALTGWTTGGNTTNPPGGFNGSGFGVDASDSSSGNDGFYAGPIGSVMTLSQNLTLAANQQYSISFFLKQNSTPVTSSNHTFSAVIDNPALTATWATLQTLSNPSSSGIFVQYSFTFTPTTAQLGGSTGSVALLFSFRNDDSYWSLDDVMVQGLQLPVITKAFNPASIQPGGTSVVTLTLSNGNATALTSGSFTDTLVNMRAVAGAVGGACGASPSSLTAGQTSLNFTAITIPANGTCTVTFTVTSSTLGAQPNSTSGVTTAQTPAVGTPSNTATLTVSSGSITISGTVTVGSVALSGVAINVTGSQAASTTTNASGFYSLSLPAAGSYTLSAWLLGFTFSPSTSPLNNPGVNQTVNFSASALPGLDYYPVTPCRVADTRVSSFPSGFGPPSFAAGETRTYNILLSPCAAAIPSSVAAYSLNFTVAPPSAGPAANLTTWPVGLPSMPNVSTLNFSASTVANAAIVPAGTNGAIDVYVNDPTNVILDIDGYFAPPASSGLQFFTVTPCRVADTRVATFPSGFGPPSLAAGETRGYAVLSSSCAAGIPSSAAAYSLNFTVVPPSTGPPANLTAWPLGLASMPNVSTLNFQSSIVANAAVVSAGANGGIDVYVNDPANVLFDINGYFAPLTSGWHFYPITPCRVADTRVAAGFTGQFGPPSLAAGQARTFNILSSPCAAQIPATVAAYSLNFTVVPPAGGPAANLTTWPLGLPTMPNVSTLNFYGSVAANAAIVPAGSGGAINVYANFPTDMLFDINGYFGP